MSSEEPWTILPVEESTGKSQSLVDKAGYDFTTGVYHSLMKITKGYTIPRSHKLDTVAFLLSQFPSPFEAERRIALIDAATDQRLTYGQLHRSIRILASTLYHGLGVRERDVIFVLSPNSLLYPVICLAIMSIGAVLSSANPLNTEQEIIKQVHDCGVKLIVSASEELHKMRQTGVPTLLITRSATYPDMLSVEELIECENVLELPELNLTQSDTAAVLYSSGTTGTSKGVILTHHNFISILTLLRWSVEMTKAQDDIFLCFIPMFHIYGLAVFALGLFSAGVTTVLMQKFELQAMVDVIQKYKVNNIPAVPPVILGLVKYSERVKCDFSSLRRIGSGAAPLSKELSDQFRERFPWVELRQGYGLTESCGATSYFLTDEEAKARSGSCGRLFPSFCAKVVDPETGSALPPNREGELWIQSPTIMNGYLGNEEATDATIEKNGWWLKTGDLCYIDEDGYIYIVDRIKELIKHNGYQVAPAELEALLLSHPQILDAAVVPVEDEAAGQIPMAYVVRAAGSELTEEQIIELVARQVAPYKKVRKVSFISAIPRSAAGKILRKELVSLSQRQSISRL